MKRTFNILVGNPEGKRPVGRPRHRWEDNIKMYLKKIGYGAVDWIHVAQDKRPVAESCEHDNELSGSITDRKFLE
jgi:hypothetical protein